MDYTFSIGSADPYGFSAANDQDAVERAVSFVRNQRADDLRAQPGVVAVLLGPGGLVTRPSERLDEFVDRLAGRDPAGDHDTVQPGDSNTPDCNGD